MNSHRGLLRIRKNKLNLRFNVGVPTKVRIKVKIQQKPEPENLVSSEEQSRGRWAPSRDGGHSRQSQQAPREPQEKSGSYRL